MKNKKLGDYVDIVSGYAFKSKEFDIKGVPVIRMSDLYQNKIRITENTARVVDINIDEKFLIQKGDILLGMSGSIGKMGIADINGKMYLNQRIAKIVPKNNEISRVFLIYLIRQMCERMKQDSVGGTVPNISPNTLKNYDVWVPSIENQKEIANTLNLASKLIEKRKEQIAELERLKKNTFINIFLHNENLTKWDNVCLKEYVTIDTKMIKDFTIYQNFIYIGIENIEKNTGKLINISRVKEVNITSGKYLFDERHVIYSKIRPNLNKVALPYEKGITSADSYPLLVKDGMNRIYLAELLKSIDFLNYAKKQSSRTNIPKINKKQLENYQFKLPPIKYQNKFASIVEEIESQKKVMEESLHEMENNFNALMQKAFRGELFPEQ